MTETKQERDANHLWHVWINQRQQERDKDQPWEHSLYEFKNMLQFLSYGAGQIQRAFEGKLPQTHRQCSRQPVEQLPVLNTLKCSRDGVDVTQCPLLLGLRDTLRSQPEYYQISDETVYRKMAETCAWHIYTKAVGVPEGHHFAIDTSMGYLMDETDRIFWDRVHSSMAASMDDSDESNPDPKESHD